jgi:hypothetical protein
MTNDQAQEFFARIDKLTLEYKPRFGIMNVNQMVCHCTDQLRAIMGTKELLEFGKVSPEEIRALVKSGETVPAPKGLGQVEGDGTKPTNLEEDKMLLKKHILEFFELPEDFNCIPHPYFGQMNKKVWSRYVIHHLIHHLGQFGV